MKLLRTPEYEELDEKFEDTEEIELEMLAPEVRGGSPDLQARGDLSGFDAAFLQLPVGNPVYGRVVLEMLEEEGVTTINPSLAFYVMAKKNYLQFILQNRGIPSPDTVVAASENAAKNATRHLEKPLVAKRYRENEVTESKIIESEGESVEEFAEGTEYGSELVLFQQKVEGEKYRAFYASGNKIPLKDPSESWEFSREKLQYSSMPSDVSEKVDRVMESIGARYGEVVLRGKKVVDLRPNPDPELYQRKSGKSAFGYIREVFE